MATIETLTDRQYCMPSGANGVTLSADWMWTNTAYQELLDCADADLILTGLCAAVVSVPDVHIIEFDVAVGAAGLEVVIATFRLYGSASGSGQNGSYLPTVIGIDAIPDESRVAVRARAFELGSTFEPTHSYRVSATYLKKPLVGTMLTTTSPLRCTQSGGAVIDLLTDINWGNGAPVAIRAASGPAWIIVGTSWQGDAAGLDYEWDLMAGGSVITTLRANQAGQDSYPNYQAFHNPLDAVPANTAVAGRARVGWGTSGYVRLCSIQYFNAPL